MIPPSSDFPSSPPRRSPRVSLPNLRAGFARAELLIGLAAIAISGAWAMWPLSAPMVNASLIARSNGRPDALVKAVTTPAPAAQEQLDVDAFRAPLWVIPPPPPPPPPPPEPAKPLPPLKLQLISITSTPLPASLTSRRTGKAAVVYRAMLYDPENDRLVTVEKGSPIGSGRVVENVDESGVTIRDPGAKGVGGGGASRVLRLHEEQQDAPVVEKKGGSKP